MIISVGIRQHPPVAACSSFRWRPCFVVGIPVDLAILDLAPEIPRALFDENPFKQSPPSIKESNHLEPVRPRWLYLWFPVRM